ncbi:4519_t:CDS:2 [Funneliformis geosporum]|uniref:11560_t:CDS:1 n=1 Tax=Funneliformis geosporum TaxID=1117311 RepID=A0A9W4SYL8_9GLOM|nr:11560_t:CDS:2 [Funneliformis geosporum]CAI2189466.1 4519_t:CDS:2 [Funneliformis geosporum]
MEAIQGNDASDKRFSDMYIYTASVCDIILNPNCLTLEVSKKSLELQLKRFREAINKNSQIKLSNSISILREEVPDISSKKKFTDDNEDEKEPPKDETTSNDISFKQYNKLFD